MQGYVLAFLFTPDRDKVWLIRKQKPSWQVGCLNGIGGKLLDPDEPPIDAIVRELKEETDLTILPEDLYEVGVIKSDYHDQNGFFISVYAGTTTAELRTMEIEEVGLYDLNALPSEKTIPNLKVLVEACLYKLENETGFFKIVMLYE